MKYVNRKELYEKAKVNRINKDLVKSNIQFVEKAKTHIKEIISQMFIRPVPDIDPIKYKPINY